MPQRSMSFFDVAADIISIAQQASPDSSGHRLFIRIRSRTQVGLGRDDLERAPAGVVAADEVRVLEPREVGVLGRLRRRRTRRGSARTHSVLGTTMGCVRSRGSAATSVAGRAPGSSEDACGASEGWIPWASVPAPPAGVRSSRVSAMSGPPLRHAYASPSRRMPTNTSMLVNSRAGSSPSSRAFRKTSAHRKMNTISMSNATNSSA